jgi:hypothetical protein
MTDETLLRELVTPLEAVVRQTQPVRAHVAALLKAPGGEKLAALLAQRPGLRELLDALDALNKPTDPSKTSVYDRIRQDVARKHEPHADESIPLAERLRMR